MTRPPVRIAFCGLGDHALRAHLVHLLRSARCKVIGGLDPVRTTESHRGWLEAQGLGLDASFRPYADLEPIAADGEVDAVVIASPDRFHLAQLQRVVEAGKHALCEKPLCAARAELPALRSILRLAADKGLSVTSCHPRRFDPPYVWLAQRLPELVARYGRVLQLSLDFSYHAPSAEKSGLHGGSLLADHANHEVDYANFLLGRSGAVLTRLADGHDHYALSGVRDDGVIVHFHGTRRLAARIYPETVRVRFERGEVELSSYDARLSRIVAHERIVHGTGTAGAAGACVHAIDHPVTDYEKRFRDVNEDWLDSIVLGKPGYLAAEDMLYNAAASVGFGEDAPGCLRLGKDGLE